jgi:hypothetical protein
LIPLGGFGGSTVEIGLTPAPSSKFAGMSIFHEKKRSKYLNEHFELLQAKSQFFDPTNMEPPPRLSQDARKSFF